MTHHGRISMRTFFLVAFLIAAAAFVIGQFFNGAGVIFAALASTLWTAYSASRPARVERKNV